MTFDFQALAAFGWSNHFQLQLSVEELEASLPARVLSVHRSTLEVGGPAYAGVIPRSGGGGGEDEIQATVGDWLLLEPATQVPKRLLARHSLFKRRAAGTAHRVQLIAANVDTLFIVTSCNQEFNIARLERYLVLAREADVLPIVVLTKADLAADPDRFLSQAADLAPGLLVERMDARSHDAVRTLAPWCGPGQTVALVGSSGVGKSTLVNSLAGTAGQATQTVRADDDRGRHTTTSRSLHRLPTGGWLLDTPGMRELQLLDSREGIEDLFADIAALAAACRFSDCRHETEPGCAVKAALERGALDRDRLRRFGKLQAEEARNSEAIHQRRARERGFGKMVKAIMQEKEGRKR